MLVSNCKSLDWIQVKLTCVVDVGSSGSQSAAVFWYLDGQALDWLGQTGRGRGVQVTEKRGNQVKYFGSLPSGIRLVWQIQCFDSITCSIMLMYYLVHSPNYPTITLGLDQFFISHAKDIPKQNIRKQVSPLLRMT